MCTMYVFIVTNILMKVTTQVITIDFIVSFKATQVKSEQPSSSTVLYRKGINIKL